MIANMGAELGATTTVFPSDEETRHFLHSEGRAADWCALAADAGCSYDDEDEIDLSELEPLVATPSSPGNVVKVGEIEGKDVYQAYIGSSANPGWRDFAVAAEIVRGKTVPSNVSFDVNPTSRQLLETLIADGGSARSWPWAPAFIKPGAMAALAWAKRLPLGKTRCAPRRAIFPAARALKRIRSFSARRRRRPPRRCLAALPIHGR